MLTNLAHVCIESLTTRFLTPPLTDPQAKRLGLLPKSPQTSVQQRCGTGNDLHRPGTWQGIEYPESEGTHKDHRDQLLGTSGLLLLTGMGSLRQHEEFSRHCSQGKAAHAT